MFLPPGTVVGSYRVEGLLGRGGMAVVYEASHEALDRRVALKLLGGELASDPEFVERFRREGRLQASLEHPHVVTVYEAGESEHGLYLAMRLVRGPTLAALLLDGVLDARRSLGMLEQVAAAIDHAHAAGLVHRDVKPKNVLVGEGDDAYLSDFGLTKLGGSSGITVTGEVVGTLAYLAPEVILGRAAGPESDVYAFGAMLFECLSGTTVFPRASQAAVLYAHTSEPPPRITGRRPELPPALNEVFARALAKDPGERPGSAGAVVASASDALADAGLEALGPPPPAVPAAPPGSTIEPLPPMPVPATRRDRRGRGILVLAAGMLLGAALATGVALLVSGGDDGTPDSAVPPPAAGSRVLGSDLAARGRARDCRAGRPSPDSPACVIAQTSLPGATLVVPTNGVIRRWSVRSARGELALTVLRERGGGAFRVANSRNEFVTDPGVHTFDTELAVDAGDRVGLVVLPGSAVGAAPATTGATTSRWMGEMNGRRPPDRTAGTGFDDELLLRVEYVPGAHQRLPHQVRGAAAATLPAGKERARRRLRFADGRPVAVALVEVRDAFALDLFSDRRRVARMDVPDFRPGDGRLVLFDVEAEPTEPEQIYVDMQYVNGPSTRIIDHFVVAYAREFEFIS
jgi:serine/threonine-protein kinase